MGQKVHPRGFRLGVSSDWQAKWFSKKKYSEWLEEDEKIRTIIKGSYGHSGISEVFVERPDNEAVTITIRTARPGVVIGKKGSEIGSLRERLERELNRRVLINVDEVKTPETDAQLIAENIAGRIEKRASYKRAMKRALSDALRRGALGVKIMVSGRLAGAEIARREWYLRGRLPLQTMRAKLSYGTAVAQTKYGTIGIKVWIYNGDAKV
ncbi:MAG: 30S ribosomal protein S3 [Thermotogae bacterium]|nr:MAG: 30S ribosomal protein S3 [Thermotogota bacterium]